MAKKDKRVKRKEKKKQKRASEHRRYLADLKYFEEFKYFCHVKDCKKAIEVLKEANEIDPSYGLILLQLTYCSIDLNNYNNAIRYASKLLYKEKYKIEGCNTILEALWRKDSLYEFVHFYKNVVDRLREPHTNHERILIENIRRNTDHIVNQLRGRYHLPRKKCGWTYEDAVKDFLDRLDKIAPQIKLISAVPPAALKKPPAPVVFPSSPIKPESSQAKSEKNKIKSESGDFMQLTLFDTGETPAEILPQMNHKPDKTEKRASAEESDKPGKISPPVRAESKTDGSTISFDFNFNPGPVLDLLKKNIFEDTTIYKIRLQGEHILLMKDFDGLLCLDALRGVEQYWYQIETVKKVLKYFRGRALLCDEVGLGKTIEAGMILKEYILRGLAERILILTPPSLVPQWKLEMEEKFGLEFITTNDLTYSENPEKFWSDNPMIIASISTAKSRKNFESVTGREFDIVIIDEAHHIRNNRTLAWKLVNSLKKTFILLLTATPVQNDMMELYNLITLISPGTLYTPSQFRQTFVVKSDLRKPKNMDRLRELMHTVMIRNTRAMVDIKLPPRYASTYRIEQTPEEREIYVRVQRLAREMQETINLSKMIVSNILSRAGSSIWALAETLENMLEKENYGKFHPEIEEILSLCEKTAESGKIDALIEIIKKNRDKKIVFTKYLATIKHLIRRLSDDEIPIAVFHGGLSSLEKEKQINLFCDSAEVLISTEVGGEGKNLQFCNTMINFDLPWNPMRIEQRIGRIHRIGQERKVFIFNLSQRETLEDYILGILDEKINMFELVVGEIGMILGNLDPDKEFPDIVLELWSSSKNEMELKDNFERLGDDLIKSKEKYMKTKEIDEVLFAEDYEV